MLVTRRFVLTGSATLAAAALLPLAPVRAWAVTSLTSGDLRIDSVSDGHLELPPDLAFSHLPEADRDELLARIGMDGNAPLRSPLNITLMRQGDKVVLFDVGSGPDFVPTAGTLLDALAAVDVSPEDVTDILFTHAHPDHIWGLLDEFDEVLFPNARLQIGRAEFDYWMDPETARTIGEERLSFAAGALRRLRAVQDVIEKFEDGAEVLPGVVAVGTPGHTPGHTSFAIGKPDGGIFVTGDFVTNLIGFARPDISGGTDHDPALASGTRAAMLARLADEGWTILGYHLPDGGIGKVARDGDAFSFIKGE